MKQGLHSVINASAVFQWMTQQFHVEVRLKSHHGGNAVWISSYFVGGGDR